MTPKRASEFMFSKQRDPFYSGNNGMTIAEHARIEFAKAAMLGIVINNKGVDVENIDKLIAVLSFQFADEMLKQGGYIE